MKHTQKQMSVIERLKNGYHLYENPITSGARWSLGMFEGNYRWGSVNGNVISKLIKANLIEITGRSGVCYQYNLTELGKTIKL